MRIAVDATCWMNRRGYGRFARALITSMVEVEKGHEYTLITDFEPDAAPPVPPGVQVARARTVHPAAAAAAADGRRTLSDMWAVGRTLSDPRFDLVFFPSAYTYVPVLGAKRLVVVIHDVIAEQFPRHVFPNRRAAAFWRLKLWLARTQADMVMTVSEASREGLAQRFDIPRQRIVVVPEAADPIFGPRAKDDEHRRVLDRFGLLERSFLLYVGGISPHKNLRALLQSFAELRRDAAQRDSVLLLVGDYSRDVFYSAYEELAREARKLELGDSVQFAGYVPDADLAHLYNAATIFVLPSLLEGFGLPAIEAMASGAPVVVSNRGALPEVVGDAGLVFDPDVSGSLTAALRRLLDDAALRAQLQALGRQRAATFSWERAARATLAGFRSLAGPSSN